MDLTVESIMIIFASNLPQSLLRSSDSFQ